MPGPKKGMKPQTNGVPGVLTDEVPEGVTFGTRLRRSLYDPLLLQLQRAGNGKFLRFDDLRAKPSILARARKLNIKILFGEQGSTLWVTLANAEISSNGHVDPQPSPKARPLPDIVLEAIAQKNELPGLMTTYARSHGAPGVSISAVDSVILELARAGKIKLKPVRGKTDDIERWVVA